jgi:putative sigma-54 modulation protein
MKIQIKTTNMDMTLPIREYVEKKLASLEKFIPDAGRNALAEVEVGTTTHHHKAGNIFRAELNLTFPGGKIYVESEQEDLYAAIDEMRDTADRELVSKKNKKQTLAMRGAAQLKKILRREK